jgi:hypothetical protein
MAMKESLILGAIVLLLVSWFALDAVAEIILPLKVERVGVDWPTL